MNEQIRAEFEQAFVIPPSCVYNAEMDHYGWMSHPKTEHPFNAQYETWLAAQARYAGSGEAVSQLILEKVYDEGWVWCAALADRPDLITDCEPIKYRKTRADALERYTHPPAQAAQQEEIDRLKRQVEWYSNRCDALQKQQSVMRDPERKMVCDILANGKTFEQAAQPQVPDGFVIVERSALSEVLRISDREHPAWESCRSAMLTARGKGELFKGVIE
jgi:hypothetical protein